MLLGLDVLCDGRRAFINCTRDILLKDYVTLLASEQAVVEILETVPADDLVMAAWRRLKESGYTIALDDFGINDPREALTDVADIIKVDLRETSTADAANGQTLRPLALSHAGGKSGDARGVHGLKKG